MPLRTTAILLVTLSALVLVAGLGGATATAHADAVPSITSSGAPDFAYPAEGAFDGDLKTRWASRAVSETPQWLLIDFGKQVPINALAIHWERAFCVAYQVQVSDDAQQWQTVYDRKDGVEEVTTIRGLGARARYLRIYCTKSCPDWAHVSIWEVDSPDPETAAAFKQAQGEIVAAREQASRELRERLVEALHKLGAEEIIFAVRQPGRDGHWYANFSYYAASTDMPCYNLAGGKLVALNPATGKTRVIFADPRGSIRDPQVHYDGQRIIFSYLPGGETHYHLYEISADGTGLRQLTSGDYDDIEPTYLPDGDIVFCSSRCKRWVNCWLTQVATLHRCDANGGNIRMLSANVEQDNTAWPLPDGRLIYTRWEYVDRSQVDYHHLWTMNPDGTQQMVYFGNLHPSTVMIDAKPIPGTRKVVALFSPGHGKMEHAGRVTIVDPGDGPDDQGYARPISRGDDFRDPYVLDEDHFLVAGGPELVVVDSASRERSVYRLPDEDARRGLWLNEPRPLAPRPREEVIPSRVHPEKATGRMLLANVYQGRNMVGVKPGDIAKLLILESLPKPINYTGGMDPLTLGGSFTLERVAGTVPVEADGSAYFELPALRSFFVVALDKNNLSVKRMQSFMTVQPGETSSCVGCHEQRTQVLPMSFRPTAARRAPSKIAPVAGVPEVFDFPRDIQPILDRNCVTCHNCAKHSGGVVLTGDRGPMFSHSYFYLTAHGQFVDGRNRAVSNLAPRTIGAVASPIMKKLTGGHHGVNATPQDVEMVRYWIESAAPYPGTYAALGSGSIGGNYMNAPADVDNDWPTTKAGGEVMARRCAVCHTGDAALPTTLSDENHWWHSRHCVFNLSHPENSTMLLGPLAKAAGGYGACEPRKDGQPKGPVFASKDDPDYRTLLAMIVAGQQKLDLVKRFDMAGFRPPLPYLREMVRYGVLGAMPKEGDTVDAYALDRRYWESLWYKPVVGEAKVAAVK